MTTLYRPVLIESAEQAEALPEGTVATHPDHWPREKFQSVWQECDSLWDNSAMVGWTALVPIEAEEEWALVLDDEGSMDVAADEAEVREWVLLGDEPRPPVTRLVTPWQEA